PAERRQRFAAAPEGCCAEGGPSRPSACCASARVAHFDRGGQAGYVRGGCPGGSTRRPVVRGRRAPASKTVHRCRFGWSWVIHTHGRQTRRLSARGLTGAAGGLGTEANTG